MEWPFGSEMFSSIVESSWAWSFVLNRMVCSSAGPRDIVSSRSNAPCTSVQSVVISCAQAGYRKGRGGEAKLTAISINIKF